MPSSHMNYTENIIFLLILI
uniref:Uncharacterized protein n=1 Tax=Arundo donax TaxID=35708 RepID=A0A0A8YBV0_ARUDO